MNPTKELGDWGEQEAARYLQQKGLKLIDRHFQTKRGEIDLICKDGDTFVFVEVKTRLHPSEPSAVDALTPFKQKRLIGAALMYMKKRRLTSENMRFDVVTLEGGQIEWIPSAFEAPSYYTF